MSLAAQNDEVRESLHDVFQLPSCLVGCLLRQPASVSDPVVLLVSQPASEAACIREGEREGDHVYSIKLFGDSFFPSLCSGVRGVDYSSSVAFQTNCLRSLLR